MNNPKKPWMSPRTNQPRLIGSAVYPPAGRLSSRRRTSRGYNEQRPAQRSYEGRDVFVYFNNDFEGHAVDNARQLAAAVGQT